MGVHSHINAAREAILALAPTTIPVISASATPRNTAAIETILATREQIARALAEIAAAKKAFYAYEEEAQEADRAAGPGSYPESWDWPFND